MFKDNPNGQTQYEPAALSDEITELRERCAFYERTNAEQAAILNRVIAERDDYRAALEYIKLHRLWINSHAKAIVESALAKHSPEDDLEEARRMV